jgi:hypothetical protein
MLQWKSFNTPPKDGDKILAMSKETNDLYFLTYAKDLPYTDCIGWMDADDLLNAPLGYDPNFGDDTLCLCGHTYRRHFDSYGDLAPVGCRYCLPRGNVPCGGVSLCAGFQTKVEK